MIKTFELYLILLFAKKILNTFLIFFTLIFILNLFEEINFFKDLQTNPFFPIILSGLNAPATLFEIFPFIFLIGTQFFIGIVAIIISEISLRYSSYNIFGQYFFIAFPVFSIFSFNLFAYVRSKKNY